MTLIDNNTSAAQITCPADAWTPTRAAARFAADAARIAELESALTAAQQRAVTAETGQITEGSDPRLHDFWVQAGETAYSEGFCEEYDRIAEAMGGVGREREWDVEMEVTLTFNYTHTATCRDRDDAYAIASESLDTSDIREALSWVSPLDVSTEHVSTDRS